MNLSHVHWMMPSTSDFSTHKNVLVLAALFVSLTRNFLSNPMETHEPRGLHNSAIHKAAGSLVTRHSQKYRQQKQPPETIPPLMASWLEQ